MTLADRRPRPLADRCLRPLAVPGRPAASLYSLAALQQHTGLDLSRWPRSLRLLLECVLRHGGRADVGDAALQALLRWTPQGERMEVPFVPARVLAPDASGIPLFADLCAMRERAMALGIDADSVQPVVPVDLVIDHSLEVDRAGSADALLHNVREEFRRNGERYAFLKWAAGAFRGVRLMPPGMGIIHQINMEHLAEPVREDAQGVLYPDSVVGPDSHTCMAGGLGLLAWGVGGIEAESVMLGQPLSLRAPEVVGVELRGQLAPGATATDLALHVTHRLRQAGVVGCFVEFFGDGVPTLRAEDRCTVANMAPEYGATVAYFGVDDETLAYFTGTGRDAQAVAAARAWYERQGLFGPIAPGSIDYSRTLVVELGGIGASVAGPSRPQDLMALADVAGSLPPAAAQGQGGVHHGDVVIAAITSCANTSNPAALVTAGLLAQAAVARGLRVPAYVKTSFTPGSQAAAAHLAASGLQDALDALGFQVAGFGCATCIGNSGPLQPEVEAALQHGGGSAAAVLSGNRNFEGRIHPRVKAAYLMSPALVVAHALAGTVTRDLTSQPLATDAQGQPVYLRDLWPDDAAVQALAAQARSPLRVRASYADTRRTGGLWESLPAPQGEVFAWDAASTWLLRPPYFDTVPPRQGPVTGARALLLLGDSVTTDHISPGSPIATTSDAGRYLASQGVHGADMGSYIARRANHEVMVRGAFASPRLRNGIAGAPEGGMTVYQPTGEAMTVYAAAQRHAQDGVPLVVIAGREYGTGSSRDWAAKGTLLLGVRAVIAVSFERIHRSNLVGMGVLPCEFRAGEDADVLQLRGDELFDLDVPLGPIAHGELIQLDILRADGSRTRTWVVARIDTPAEARQFAQGGILHAALRSATRDAAARPLEAVA